MSIIRTTTPKIPHYFFCSNRDKNTYTHGTTNSVNTVEINTPPMTAIAIGTRVSAPGPKANAGGIDATIVVNDVINIGRKRIGHAVFNASIIDTPSARIWLVKSTSKIEFFFTSPIKRIIPMTL